MDTDTAQYDYCKDSFILCPHCDLIQRDIRLNPGFHAQCKRCGFKLKHKHKDAVNKATAICTACLILFFPAVFAPVLTLNLFGQIQSASIFTGIYQLFVSGFPVISIIIFLFTILIPFLKLIFLFYVLLSIYFKIKFPKRFLIYKFYNKIDVFGMQQVYFIGILVALTKIGSIADTSIEPGFYFLAALILLNTFNESSLSNYELWKKLECINENQ